MMKSSYVLMFNDADTEGKIAKFKQLEIDMIEEYLDEKRKLNVQMEMDKEEEPDDDGVVSEGRDRRFLVESTGSVKPKRRRKIKSNTPNLGIIILMLFLTVHY
jgi:hypothetical protein